MSQNPTRVLQICDSPSRGSGVLNVILNWHRNLDRTKVQLDYLCFLSSINSAQEEIKKMGGQCYLLPNPNHHPVKFLRESYRFFKTHRYHTVHSHITHLNFFFYPLAKWFGTKNIIQHAHLTAWGNKKISAIRNYVMLHAVWPLITHKMACSQAAGEAYYGTTFTLINNGIDIDKFTYNPSIRAQKRKELGLEKNFVIGNIGRFVLQKNHTFLLDVFKEIVSRKPSARLVLVGAGSLEKSIKQKAISLNLQDKVLFLGSRKDVSDLYQALDVLCMPSLHEGLPVVGVEAQVAGLLCVFADTITPEVLLLPSSYMLSLKDAPTVWAEKILSLKDQPRTSGADLVRAKGFDIRQTAQQIQNFYLELEK